MKYRKNSTIRPQLVFFLGFILTFYFRSVAGNIQEVTKDFSFVAKTYATSAVEPRVKILVTKKLKGNIVRIVSSDTANKIVLNVTGYKDDIQREYRIPDLDIPSYTVAFLLNKEESMVNISFIDEQDPNLIVTDIQLRLALQIFEMSMLDVLSGTFETTDDKQLVFNTEVYNYFDFDMGKQDIRQIRGGQKLTSFKALPMFQEATPRHYQLFDIQMDAITLRMSSRTMDYKTGQITHAVDLNCSYRTDEWPEVVPDKEAVMNMLDTPEQFRYFYYYELQVED